MSNWIGRLAVGLLIAVAPGAALAWDESVDGDLSTNPAAPTPVTFAPGQNVLIGTVTTGAPADTRDYITFTIPAGQQLIALQQINWQDGTTGGPGNRGFHAINAGATSFVPDGTTENLFLGGDHVDPAPIGTNLLPELSDGDTAGTGFSLPLGPGTYSYVIQQTGPQLNRYNMRFIVGPVPVPALDPWALVLLAGSLGAFAALAVRKRMLRPSIG